MTPSLRTRAVSALGRIEIFDWGSTYYLMAVLSGRSLSTPAGAPP